MQDSDDEEDGFCFACTELVISEKRMGEYAEQFQVLHSLFLCGKKKGIPYEVLVMIYMYIDELYEKDRRAKRVQRTHLLHGFQAIGLRRRRKSINVLKV